VTGTRVDEPRNQLELARSRANHTRYRPGQDTGHYESFFLRANHANRSLAFWIRYTIFSPAGSPDAALGELWAVYFDGESGHHMAVKEEVPLSQCTFKTSELFVAVDDARLEPGALAGSAAPGGHSFSWDLTFSGDAEPLFMLPVDLYEAEVPRAKALVALPMALFNGSLHVDGKEIEVADWVGSQNHNWGTRHTDHYAWGQVAGFDTHPDSFLEVATARLKIGESWTPFMTPIVLRHQGEEIALNSMSQATAAKGSFYYFNWDFSSETDAIRLDGRISAPREAFVGLRYYNPPGGEKHCLNTKIASCELQITRKGPGGRETMESLRTTNRAAFEILTDDRDHGVEIRA
jgi:hypothetical protein